MCYSTYIMTKSDIEKLWIDITEKCGGCFSEEKMLEVKNVFSIAAKYSYIVELFDKIANRFKVVK